MDGDDLRRAESAVREGGGGRDAGRVDGAAAGPDRGARRQHGSFHVLAGARRTRRRIHGARDATDGIQIIDARDLAAFAVDAIEMAAGYGAYNVVSPPGMFTMGALIARACAPPARWRSRAAAARGVGRSDLPRRAQSRRLERHARVDRAAGRRCGLCRDQCLPRAQSAGLTITPMRKTVRDTLSGTSSGPKAERTKLKAGIEPEHGRNPRGVARDVDGRAHGLADSVENRYAHSRS